MVLLFTASNPSNIHSVPLYSKATKRLKRIVTTFEQAVSYGTHTPSAAFGDDLFTIHTYDLKIETNRAQLCIIMHVQVVNCRLH